MGAYLYSDQRWAAESTLLIACVLVLRGAGKGGRCGLFRCAHVGMCEWCVRVRACVYVSMPARACVTKLGVEVRMFRPSRILHIHLRY